MSYIPKIYAWDSHGNPMSEHRPHRAHVNFLTGRGDDFPVPLRSYPDLRKHQSSRGQQMRAASPRQAVLAKKGPTQRDAAGASTALQKAAQILGGPEARGRDCTDDEPVRPIGELSGAAPRAHAGPPLEESPHARTEFEERMDVWFEAVALQDDLSQWLQDVEQRTAATCERSVSLRDREPPTRNPNSIHDRLCELRTATQAIAERWEEATETHNCMDMMGGTEGMPGEMALHKRQKQLKARLQDVFDSLRRERLRSARPNQSQELNVARLPWPCCAHGNVCTLACMTPNWPTCIFRLEALTQQYGAFAFSVHLEQSHRHRQQQQQQQQQQLQQQLQPKNLVQGLTQRQQSPKAAPLPIGLRGRRRGDSASAAAAAAVVTGTPGQTSPRTTKTLRESLAELWLHELQARASAYVGAGIAARVNEAAVDTGVLKSALVDMLMGAAAAVATPTDPAHVAEGIPPQHTAAFPQSNEDHNQVDRLSSGQTSNSQSLLGGRLRLAAAANDAADTPGVWMAAKWTKPLAFLDLGTQVAQQEQAGAESPLAHVRTPTAPG
eukprot:COSAG05_NODE_153_length_15894_cov_27.910415_22_plen_553_part_00